MSECPFANMIDPDTYANGMPYDELKRIRDDGPVHYMEDPTMGVPYWLITGRDEIDFISKNPKLFSSEARSALAREIGPVARFEPHEPRARQRTVQPAHAHWPREPVVH